ncbi:MAG: lysoplasmalogenase [Trueperaceae bacterium]|nr:lysoplasmalogenase [Trueperaceae bacterium]
MSIFGALLSPAVMIATSAICAIIAGQKSSRAFYLFKPLTTVMIILYGLLALESLNDRRGIAVIIGLLFSLLGDTLLMFPRAFVAGLASFLVTHLLYSLAFFSGFSTGGLVFIALPLVIYGFIMLLLLWSKLGTLKVPVMLYILAILFMTYQAGERWLELRDLASLLAFSGTLLFALSDSLLAFDRFRQRLEYAQSWVLSTYYAAQWLIALSLFLRFR